MHVTKRNGNKEDVDLNKISSRIEKLCNGLNVDPMIVSMKTVAGLYPGVKTSELDELAKSTFTLTAALPATWEST